MLVNFMSIYLLSYCLHKVQPFRLTGGLFEGESIISFLYVGCQGVSEVGEIFWRGLGSLFMVDQLWCKTRCFWENILGGRHGHRCKESNESKYLWYDFSLMYLSLTLLLRLNPEILRFTYYRIRQEDCEGTLWYSPLGEFKVSTSRLTLEVFCALLEWLA